MYKYVFMFRKWNVIDLKLKKPRANFGLGKFLIYISYQTKLVRNIYRLLNVIFNGKHLKNENI